MSKKQYMRLHIKCPNCRKPLYGYKTYEMSEITTEVTYECRNPLCGIRCIANASIVRLLQKPVTLINRGMTIPMSPLVAKNDELLNHLPISNETTDFGLIDEAMPQRDLFYQAEPEIAAKPTPKAQSG